MIDAYSAGASSQTKWPASMILRRLFGSRSSRNSALATGTTRSWRPLMIVTGVVIVGSSAASSGSSSGYLAGVAHRLDEAVALVAGEIVGADVVGDAACDRAHRRLDDDVRVDRGGTCRGRGRVPTTGAARRAQAERRLLRCRRSRSRSARDASPPRTGRPTSRRPVRRCAAVPGRPRRRVWPGIRPSRAGREGRRGARMRRTRAGRRRTAGRAGRGWPTSARRRTGSPATGSSAAGSVRCDPPVSANADLQAVDRPKPRLDRSAQRGAHATPFRISSSALTWAARSRPAPPPCTR